MRAPRWGPSRARTWFPLTETFGSPNFRAVEPGERATLRTDGRAAGHGLRRVDYVRLLVGGARIRAELVGVGYRLPIALPVSLPCAARLIADGAPAVTRHLEVVPPNPAVSA